MMARITIMRGLPGSGKSTYIHKFLGNAEVFSADNFHMVNGVHRYNPNNISLAHNECLYQYISATFVEKKNNFVVDNTNTTLVELAPYVRIAEALNIAYEIVYLPCDPAVAMKRNTHSVPANTILKMYANLTTEIVPTYWKQTVIFSNY